jgi:hypothetical protein
MLLCCAVRGKEASKEGSKQGSPSTPGRLEPASKLAKASEETSKQMRVCVCVSLKTYFRLEPEDDETHILFTRKTKNTDYSSKCKKKVRSRNKCEPTIGHANNYVRNCKDLGLETTSNSCVQCRLFKASFSGATWSWRPRFRPPDRLFGYITILPGPQIYYWADLSCRNCINLTAGRPRASAGICS